MIRMFIAFILALAGILAVISGPVRADEPQTIVPDRFAMTMTAGHFYDPSSFQIPFGLVSWVALLDHERVWPLEAPDAVRFKVELSAGSTAQPHARLMASACMLSLYYFDGLDIPGLRPYAEAGIGGIYTEDRWEGQGSRLNFNPQIGLGTEFGGRDDAHPYFAAFRLFHISNAHLHQDNRGANAITLQVGFFF